MARVDSPLPKTYHEPAGEFFSVTRLNAIIHANKEQFDAIIRQSSPANVFLVVSSTRTRKLAAGSRACSRLWETSRFNELCQPAEIPCFTMCCLRPSALFSLWLVPFSRLRRCSW